MTLLTPSEWLNRINELEPGTGVVILVAGLIYVLAGWRVFRALVIVNSAAVGGLIGLALAGAIGGSVIWQIVIGLALAIALGAGAMRVVRAAAMIGASLVGAVLGVVVAGGMSSTPQTIAIGAGVGLVVSAALVFVVFEHLVIVTMSFQGALMSVAGMLAAISQQSGFLRNFRELAYEGSLLVPFTILALTIIGICVQMAGLRSGGTGSASG